jgi:hypothetical protein
MMQRTNSNPPPPTYAPTQPYHLSHQKIDFGGENLRVRNLKGGQVLLNSKDAQGLGLMQLIKVGMLMDRRA